MNNLTRSALASLVLVSLFPQLACSGSGSETTASPDPKPGEMTPPGEGRFLLTLEASKLPVLQGDSATVKVSVERKDGFEGPVEVSAEGLPRGVVAVQAVALDHGRILLGLLLARAAARRAEQSACRNDGELGERSVHARVGAWAARRPLAVRNQRLL